MHASAWLIFRSNWLVLADTQLHPLARAWMIPAPSGPTIHLLDRYSIGLETMVRLVQTAQF
jgi:hypothetical protein